ncbi:homing endonuclease associated repeat-containing protein [Parvibium lacunae]|uniref:HNH endonuclease n=1 Tax=Parvibium lacunae TaxID=1888893 RepID=A0A368L407_9BURK|nr:HNH endonuclease [Parvibium lacunae]RCS58297.1 HNH endonuclease [Parvibium lacunae]
MKFELEIHHRNVPERELVDDLARVARELNKDKVTIDEYNERGHFHGTTLTRRFGSWFKALELAGLGKTRNLNISNEELFENLVQVWTSLGRQPKYNDLTKEFSKYSSGTYEKRFGTWRQALESFVLWANDGKLTEAEEGGKVQGRKTPRNINWRLRAIVLMKDGARCRLCGVTPQDGARLHVDHIIPWANGGETVVENLQILCEKCNIGKSNIEVEKNG